MGDSGGNEAHELPLIAEIYSNSNNSLSIKTAVYKKLGQKTSPTILVEHS